MTVLVSSVYKTWTGNGVLHTFDAAAPQYVFSSKAHASSACVHYRIQQFEEQLAAAIRRFAPSQTGSRPGSEGGMLASGPAADASPLCINRKVGPCGASHALLILWQQRSAGQQSNNKKALAHCIMPGWQPCTLNLLRTPYTCSLSCQPLVVETQAERQACHKATPHPAQAGTSRVASLHPLSTCKPLTGCAWLPACCRTLGVRPACVSCSPTCRLTWSSCCPKRPQQQGSQRCPAAQTPQQTVVLLLMHLERLWRCSCSSSLLSSHRTVLSLVRLSCSWTCSSSRCVDPLHLEIRECRAATSPFS